MFWCPVRNKRNKRLSFYATFSFGQHGILVTHEGWLTKLHSNSESWHVEKWMGRRWRRISWLTVERVHNKQGKPCRKGPRPQMNSSELKSVKQSSNIYFQWYPFMQPHRTSTFTKCQSAINVSKLPKTSFWAPNLETHNHKILFSTNELGPTDSILA